MTKYTSKHLSYETLYQFIINMRLHFALSELPVFSYYFQKQTKARNPYTEIRTLFHGDPQSQIGCRLSDLTGCCVVSDIVAFLHTSEHSHKSDNWLIHLQDHLRVQVRQWLSNQTETADSMCKKNSNCTFTLTVHFTAPLKHQDIFHHMDLHHFVIII